MNEKLEKEKREEILGRAIHNEVATGNWRVESQTSYNATLVKGKHTSHLLHAALSLVTCGAWILVWAIVAYCNRRQVLMMTVDEYGNINKSK